MKTEEFTCISCPMGCQITVELDNGEVLSVRGNSCQRGDVYVRKEATNPTRIVTSTVIISGGDRPRLAVKTKVDVPKNKIFAVMKDINAVQVEAPKHIGDVIIENAAGTGVPVVATGNVAARK